MNLYEINQEAYKNTPPMKEEDVLNVVHEYVVTHPSTYYMMLNHDIHYFTVFNNSRRSIQKVSEAIVKIAIELGEIVDAVINSDNKMLELWIRYDGEIIMFGVFDYYRGVVEI